MSYGNMEKVKHVKSFQMPYCILSLASEEVEKSIDWFVYSIYFRNYTAVQCYMHMFVRKWKCPYGHVCTFMHSVFFNLGALQVHGFQFPQLLALAKLTRRI